MPRKTSGLAGIPAGCDSRGCDTALEQMGMGGGGVGDGRRDRDRARRGHDRVDDPIMESSTGWQSTGF